MARVRVFEAAAEGFRLIGREPKAVLVWSAALFVLMGLPAIFMVQQLAPVFASMSVAMDDESGEAMMLAMGRMFAIMPLAYLIMIVGYTVVGEAVLRAVIAPSDRRYFYLRVSSAEGWMALSAVVGIILAYIASALLLFIGSLVIILPIAFLAAAAGGVGDAFSGVHWVLVLGIFAFEIAMAYLWLRFSMAPIISFDERRFRLGLHPGSGVVVLLAGAPAHRRNRRRRMRGDRGRLRWRWGGHAAVHAGPCSLGRDDAAVGETLRVAQHLGRDGGGLPAQRPGHGPVHRALRQGLPHAEARAGRGARSGGDGLKSVAAPAWRR